MEYIHSTVNKSDAQQQEGEGTTSHQQPDWEVADAEAFRDRAGGQLQTFATCLFEPDDLIEIRLIPNDEAEARKERVDTHECCSADIFAETVLESEGLNQCGYNVYAGINPRKTLEGRRNEDVALFRALFVDFDGTTEADVRQRIVDAGLPAPTMLVRSGGSGVHAYWRLSEPIVDPAIWVGHQVGLIHALNSDPKIKDPARIMRVPGLFNVKKRPYVLCELIEADPSRTYLLSVFPEVSPEVRTYQPFRADGLTYQGLPELAGSELDAFPVTQDVRAERCRMYLDQCPDSIEGQKGSDAFLRMCCECFRFGLDVEHMRQVVDWFNQHKCRPPWNDPREILHKITSAREKVVAEGAWGSRLRDGGPNTQLRSGVNNSGLNTLGVNNQGVNSLGIDGRGAREDSEAIADDVIERPDPIPLAEHFLRHQFRDAEGQLLLRRWQSDYYRFNGVCYEPVPAEAMTSRIYCHLEQCHAVRRNRQGVPMGGVVSVVPKKTMVQEVLGALPSRGLLVDGLEAPQWLIRGTNLPPAKELVACQNGLLHVPSGLLHLATPDFFTTNAVGFEYAADAPQPEKWLRFLRELWGDDQESIEALQMWFGHCLTADTTQQKIMLLVGPKRSGKGTIARVLTRLLGDSNVCSPSLAALAQNFGLSSLIGKLLATITDARLSHRTDHAVVAERLLSISGEDHVTIDRKFKEPVTVRLPTRFMILTNELPRLNDASGALAGRFVLLRLTRSFYGKENNRLTEELLTELPSILNWAVEGWRKLETRGHFDHPASSSEALRELEDLGSPMVAFVRDMCELGPQHEIEVDELFRAWKNWCEKQGREHTGTVQTFARDLRSVLPDLQCRQIRQEGRRIRLYSGITRIYEFPLLRRPLQGYPPAQQEVPQ